MALWSVELEVILAIGVQLIYTAIKLDRKTTVPSTELCISMQVWYR